MNAFLGSDSQAGCTLIDFNLGLDGLSLSDFNKRKCFNIFDQVLYY